MKYAVKFCLVLIYFCLLNPIKGQGPSTPGALLDTVFDRYGKKYSLPDIAIDSVKTFKRGVQSKTAQLCSAGYFDLYFETGSGMEGSTTTDIDRRNVICQVFSDISAFINSPLTTSGNKVKIWVRDITYVTGSPTGYLGVASSFYNVPSGTAGSIADNEIWKTIHSGYDSYTNVCTPLATIGSASSGAFYHGVIAFNFTQPGVIDWNTNLSLASSPSGYYDLYSVALHEVTHALGFASLIDYNGISKFGSSYNYFSRYDLFLKSGSSPLITNTGTCSLYNYQFNSALSTTVVAPGCTITPVPVSSGSSDNTSCSAAITYSGTTTVDVYTPNCFEESSSLSHFEDQCYPVGSPYGNNLYFTMSNANGPGPTYTKRWLKSEERLVLCDLGYNVNTTFGSSGNNNYYNYGGSSCAGTNVAGINDGITSGGSYSFTGAAGSNISISGILSNDVNADSFECLQDLTGSSSLSATSGISTTNITFNSSLSGAHLLRYIPFNSGSTQRGNITYIYVYVQGGSCTPTACNMVNNGGFESTNTCGEVGGGTSSGTVTVNVDCWNVFSNSPDAYARGCTNTYAGLNTIFTIPTPWSSPSSDTWNGTPNDHFTGMTSSASHICEALQSTLNAPVVQNGVYTLSFRAKVSNNSAFGAPPPGTNGQLTFGGSPAMLVPVYGGITALPTGITQLAAFSIINDNSWHNYVQTFTYTPATSLNNLVMINSSNMNILSGQPNVYIYADDVSLVPASQYVSFDLPDNALCITDNIPDLSVYLSPATSGGVFSGAGVGAAGTTYSLDAYTAGVGIHNISYTYTNNIGCQVVVVDAIDVVSPGSITISSSTMPSVICAGSTATLTASGATTYTWQPGGLTGTTVAITPTATTVYTITGTVCTGTAQATTTVVVNPTPTITAVAASSTICSGDATTLTAAGAGTYTWQPGNLTGYTVTVTPSVTTVYTVTGTSICGNSASTTLTVNVNPLPSLTVTASSSVICAGQSTSLTVSGAASYIWVHNGSGATTVTVAPTSGTQYTVIGISSAGCVGSTAYSVTVLALPSLTVTAGSPSICTGQSATLTASGAATYTWVPGSFTTNPLAVTPTVTTVYTVTGTSAAGCSSSKTYTVTVNALPPLTVTASPGTVCAGQASTLTASGASTYSWSTGATTSSISASPSVATVYTVTGTSAAGCSSSKQVTVAVNPLPSLGITGNASICAGQSSTLTASGASTYTWAPGSSTVNPIAVSPSVTTVYTVTGTSAAGCTSSKTYTVTVNPLPSLTITASPTPICQGQSGTLTATGASTYSWSTGVTTSTAAISPTVTSGYTVTGTSAAGCISTKTISVSVPSVSISATSLLICNSGTVTLTGSGASTYTWNPTGLHTASVAVSPTVTTTYTLSGTASGCTPTAAVTVTVSTTPTVSITGTATTICNSSATFTAVTTPTTGLTYAWAVKDLATGTLVAVPITGSATATPTINFAGLYQNVSVCATVTGTAGCSATACITLYACCQTPTNTTKYTNTTFTVNTTISGTATQKYQFGGTITVAPGVMLSISAADVTMDPGTVILLGNNATLSVQYSWLHACNAMWNGIWGTAAHTLRMEHSRIEDAIRAVVDSTGAGSYNIWNNYFNRNLYGVYAKGMNTTGGYQFYNNLFACSQLAAPTWSAYTSVTPNLSNASTLGAYATGYLLPPYQGAQSITGIMLYNSGQAGNTNSMVTVGTATAGAENVFDKLQIGINATRSGALVQNNVFQNINNATNPATYIGGVFAYGYGPGLCLTCTTPTMQVGGSSSLKNTFINNDVGVYSWLKTALTVSSNTLTGQGTAIYVKENNANYAGSGANPVLINQNKIIASQTGISLYNNTKGTYSVTENRLDNSGGAVGTYANNFAIRCAEVTLSTNSSSFPYYYVYNNLANGYYNGLYTAQTYSAQITNNELHLRADNTAGDFQFGIQFANTNNDWISNNIVDLPSLNTGSWWQFGIFCDNNTVPKIQCNNVTNMGAGIKVQGPCYTTAGNGIIGNYMLTDNYGLWLDANGEIGDQYFAFFGTNYSADNAWSGSINYDTYVTGNSNLTTAPGVSAASVLYTRTSSPYNISSNYPPTPTTGIGNPLLGHNATGLSGMCNSNTATPSFKMGSQEMIGLLLMQHGRDIAADSLVYGDNAASLRRTNREGLLRNIVLQQIDASADSALAGFMGEVQAENISRFFAIDSLIQLADSSAWAQAAGLNAAIVPADSIDDIRQAFNGLYLRSLVGPPLDSAAIADLEVLALRCPRYDGTAVFQARTLAYEYTHKLYRNACEGLGDDQQAGRPSAPAVAAQEDILLYPNPANTEVYISAKGYEQLSLSVYNIMGELVMQKQVINRQSIDVKTLNPGTYIYRLYNGYIEVKTGKLMISK